ncbi:hypothetical protein ERX46_06005 [Brumimicrobium glaciale]|uniref:Uncharacterized protein n=1 Tax=Brumimicrobium glaciale TaxID=200475 RepID=A0A4Q4KPX6_9FLAO|nr:DUF6090 family protein [Brumimicrobium glaciale]RYM34927.1 hypothetical protein ERX46_06005 [Brumimicrobium glaciale]
MIKFFRKFRQRMLIENKFGKYLLYAVGEIILVVIGILIALQINNNNEERKIKIKELSYLANIKADSHLNLIELKAYIITRERSVNSAETILEFFENIENVDPEDFNFHNLNVQIWYPFNKNNNAYQELINSGNLAIISNDSIKNLLINMELNYKQIEFIERHMRQDFESYLYPIYFSITDLQSDITNYTFQVSKGTEGTKAELSKDKMELLLKNQTFKNGFVLSIFSNNRLILDYKKMILMTEKLLSSIDSELAENK